MEIPSVMLHILLIDMGTKFLEMLGNIEKLSRLLFIKRSHREVEVGVVRKAIDMVIKYEIMRFAERATQPVAHCSTNII